MVILDTVHDIRDTVSLFPSYEYCNEKKNVLLLCFQILIKTTLPKILRPNPFSTAGDLCEDKLER